MVDRPMDEIYRYVINWELSPTDFRNQIGEMIDQAEKKGKMLALPMRIVPGMTMIDLVTLLLAHVNCDGCDAICCKTNPEGKLIALLPPECNRLEKAGHKIWRVGEDAGFPVPCPMLKNNRCSIYQDRPLVCVLFPLQVGANDGAKNLLLSVASSCPEGRRIARNVYMISWRMRKQFRDLGMEFALELFGKSATTGEKDRAWKEAKIHE